MHSEEDHTLWPPPVLGGGLEEVNQQYFLGEEHYKRYEFFDKPPRFARPPITGGLDSRFSFR